MWRDFEGRTRSLEGSRSQPILVGSCGRCAAFGRSSDTPGGGCSSPMGGLLGYEGCGGQPASDGTNGALTRRCMEPEERRGNPRGTISGIDIDPGYMSRLSDVSDSYSLSDLWRERHCSRSFFSLR